MASQLYCLTTDQRWGSYSVPRRLGNREIWNGNRSNMNSQFLHLPGGFGRLASIQMGLCDDRFESKSN
jgi:hypothetical protein